MSSHVEQYLSYQKAMLFGSQSVAISIMQMEDPALMKKAVRNIPAFNETSWKVEAQKILKTALQEKFHQNAQLKSALLETGENELGEASPTESLFGIGMSLSNLNNMNISKWRGDNIQGKVLMEVLKELQA